VRRAGIIGSIAAAVLALLPSAASAARHTTFGVDEVTNARTLTVTSDDESDAIAVSCAPYAGDRAVTVNGVVQLDKAGEAIRCSDVQWISQFGGGGDDRFDLRGITREVGFTGILNGAEEPGGAGADAVEVEGDAGRDTITGGPLSERINSVAALGGSQEGSDTIDGGPGNDEIGGTTDADKLSGGRGNDTLKPDTGADVVHGGPGRDNIVESDLVFDRSADRFYGESGNDRIIAGGGKDRLDGGSGRDWLEGNAGNDVLLGRSGNDSLYGGSGRDRLFGGAGRDLLRGGRGKDVLRGGPGKDRQKQ
jgi:Ca2+-binding RTX toxin-like protein